MRRAAVLFLLAIGAQTMANAAEALEQHPRPDWARPWVNLNGPWRFDFDPEDAGLAGKWAEGHDYHREIQAPFPWQSRLSGIADTQYQGAAWYERTLEIPSEWAGQRYVLVFGAIDWQATVWVDGKQVAEHENGYLPFEVDLTDLAAPGAAVRVTVRAYDVTDEANPVGKQARWYTPTGGIWQTVYLEARGRSYLAQGHIYPDIDKQEARAKLTCRVEEAGDYEVRVRASHGTVHHEMKKIAALAAGENAIEVTLPIPEPALWSPETPNLYDATIELLRGGETLDRVHTYFGMRKVSRGPYNGSAHEYILLNNKPIYLRGALHQSFNPEGIYTHPNDDFIRRDYELVKALGLNMLRLHIKIEEPRALYWADKLGVLIMADIPNFWVKGPRSREHIEATLRGAVARDFNHPSIFAWVNFNETWGIGDRGYDRDTQEWVRAMYRLAKELDPTRLVEDNSPCYYDHVETDINSWHFYIEDLDKAERHVSEVVEKTFPGSNFNYMKGWTQGTAPLMNSEYGGINAGHGDRDVSWVFPYLTSQLRRHPRICGYIYTEFTDIEWEHNGFRDYDRSPKYFHFPADISIAELQADEFVGFEAPHYQRVKPGDRVALPLFLSHWSERKSLEVRVTLHGESVDGRAWAQGFDPVARTVSGPPFTTIPIEPVTIAVPEGTGLLFVVAEVLANGTRHAANYCVLDVRGESAWAAPNLYAASFPVAAYSAYSFDGQTAFQPENADKIFGYGAGFVEYRLQLPKGLRAEDVQGARLAAEIGAKARNELDDWPERIRPDSYPQTDDSPWPTEVRLSLNGVPFGAVKVARDFADARGVLSHGTRYHQGSHGVYEPAPLNEAALAALREALEGDRIVTLRFEVADTQPGGLALYGAEMGAVPADPALLIELKDGAKKPKGQATPLNPLIDLTKKDAAQ